MRARALQNAETTKKLSTGFAEYRNRTKRPYGFPSSTGGYRGYNTRLVVVRNSREWPRPAHILYACILYGYGIGSAHRRVTAIADDLSPSYIGENVRGRFSFFTFVLGDSINACSRMSVAVVCAVAIIAEQLKYIRLRAYTHVYAYVCSCETCRT